VTLLSTAGFRRGRDTRADLPPDAPLSAALLDLWRRYPHFRTFRGYLSRLDPYLGGGAMPTCRAGTRSFNIDHLGNIAPCIEKIDRPVGNLREEPLAGIVSRLRDLDEVARCQDCFTLCRGITQVMDDGLNAWRDLALRMRSV
jgi:MoaA/NifB/PqqE/SkfB family radical SAM enzyme